MSNLANFGIVVLKPLLVKFVEGTSGIVAAVQTTEVVGHSVQIVEDGLLLF
jgi:hypothetical protein